MSQRSIAIIMGCVIWAGVVYAGDGRQHGAEHVAHWAYQGEGGPEQWGTLKTEYATCRTGGQQSPINIEDTFSASLGELQFNYQAAALDILNNGHTIQVNTAAGSHLTFRGQRFDLVQYHFHTPSENTVGGKPYDMEMHLVHKNAKGELAVVGVFLKAGAANAVLQQAWQHMPKAVDQTQRVESVKLNAADLLPTSRDVYYFKGSLTTPPCSEGVNWLVMKQPIEASAEQIRQFAAVVGKNARPTQPINGRFVLSKN